MSIDVYVCQCGSFHFEWTVEFGFFEAAFAADQYHPHFMDKKTESKTVASIAQ